MGTYREKYVSLPLLVLTCLYLLHLRWNSTASVFQSSIWWDKRNSRQITYKERCGRKQVYVFKTLSAHTSKGLCTGTLHIIVLHFIAFGRYCVFLQKTQPYLEHVCWHHFSNSLCPFCVSVSHSGNSQNISNFFIIITFIRVTCGQWSLMLLLWLTEGSGDG